MEEKSEPDKQRKGRTKNKTNVKIKKKNEWKNKWMNEWINGLCRNSHVTDATEAMNQILVGDLG